MLALINMRNVCANWRASACTHYIECLVILPVVCMGGKGKQSFQCVCV